MEASLARAVELFEEIEPLEAALRDASLAATSPDIASQARSLLKGAARRGILDGPLPQFDLNSPPPMSLVSGRRVGAFEIVAPIGMGGMGEVYLAERRDAAFPHRVAIKILRVDAMHGAATFARERELLDRVNHCNIARSIDGGITADGRPWMAIDYIDGAPLDCWCAINRPTLEVRLGLFAQICDAVAHTHVRLIVHRDIKPSNVMVGAAERAYLLDFGAARLLDNGRVAFAPNQASMTPDYAAPEQLHAGMETVATDVYALGALLFELLTGRRPWQSEGSLPPIVRRFVTEEPPVASEVAAALLSPPVPPVSLKGDLDAIIGKAMQKEPANRYASVEALAADIDRTHSLRPVRASMSAAALPDGQSASAIPL